MWRSLIKGRKVLRLLLLPILTSCHLSSKVDIPGGLVYSSGGMDIEWISFETRMPSVIYRNPENGATIDRLTKVTDEQFIFEECSGMGDCALKEFNLKTSTAKILRLGIKPTYIPESNSLFFYSVPNGGVKENWLFVVDKDIPNLPHKVAKAPTSNDPQVSWVYSVTPVVRISPDEVLLVGEDHQLWIYRISRFDMSPTGIKNCLPQFIRSKTQQLVCYDAKTWDVYQIDLNTKRTEALPQLKGALGFVYIPKYDTVIYGKTRLYMLISETSDIWAYSFNTQEKIKIRSPHAYIASGFWLDRQKAR